MLGAERGHVDQEQAAGVPAGCLGDRAGGQFGGGQHGVFCRAVTGELGADVPADRGELIGCAREHPRRPGRVLAVCRGWLGAGPGDGGEVGLLQRDRQFESFLPCGHWRYGRSGRAGRPGSLPAGGRDRNVPG
ncbi:MAG TPA: hypothetical protein VNF47_10075 [Streptosporangiaceae bacterium]|nr:hypothetical protein [Streptosporangiaceae bacterium]